MTEKRFVVKAQPPLWVTSDGIEIESACHDLFDNFEEKTICQFEYDMETEKMVNLMNSLSEENKQLKQRINSRLHFYRELYENTNDMVVKRVIEDLEDILR